MVINGWGSIRLDIIGSKFMAAYEGVNTMNWLILIGLVTWLGLGMGMLVWLYYLATKELKRGDDYGKEISYAKRCKTQRQS